MHAEDGEEEQEEGAKIPSMEKLEIQRLGLDPKHNSAPNANILSSVNTFTREDE